MWEAPIPQIGCLVKIVRKLGNQTCIVVLAIPGHLVDAERCRLFPEIPF